MKTIITVSVLLFTVFSCQKTEMREIESQHGTADINNTNSTANTSNTDGTQDYKILVDGAQITVYATTIYPTTVKGPGSINYNGVYYNHLGYNISGKRSLSTNRQLQNFLYVYNVPATTGVNNIWVSVTNTIGRSIWQEVLVTFNAGYLPVQYFSEQQLKEAAQRGEITLTITGFIYSGRIL